MRSDVVSKKVAYLAVTGLVIAQMALIVGSPSAQVSAGPKRMARLSTVPVSDGPLATAGVAQAASVEDESGFEDFLQRVQNFRCAQAGDPSVAVDMSCNDATLNQDFGPDNEIAIAVDPADPLHLVAGSNDYFYRFNNANGNILATVPTGFFTSFDGGQTWIDGQIPRGDGNNAGDPSPAFDTKNGVVLMAGLDFTSTRHPAPSAGTGTSR